MRRGDDRFPMRRDSGQGLAPSGEFGGGSPWQMMRRMQEDMDRMFSQFFGQEAGGGITLSPRAETQRWSPSVDISQTEKEWCIEAELPGVNRDDIDVHVEQGHLVLSAEMRQGSGGENGPDGQGQGGRQYHHRERRFGYFQRTIPLPEDVREEEIRCEFKNGVLVVHVPKNAQTQRGPRRIPVYDANNLPSETASGRMRSEAEIEMTEDEDEAREEAGAQSR